MLSIYLKKKQLEIILKCIMIQINDIVGCPLILLFDFFLLFSLSWRGVLIKKIYPVYKNPKHHQANAKQLY